MRMLEQYERDDAGVSLELSLTYISLLVPLADVREFNALRDCKRLLREQVCTGPRLFTKPIQRRNMSLYITYYINIYTYLFINKGVYKKSLNKYGFVVEMKIHYKKEKLNTDN